jgi:alkanesulfonate monooxygenase SsuD/methylene tetrahydromethanopterin reductase-like flavin-dependent oxidoreductase (luciferase family)
MELASVAHSLACSVVGSPETVRAGLESIIAQTRADELILTAQIYDHEARLRAFEIGAQVRDAMAAKEQKPQTAV